MRPAEDGEKGELGARGAENREGARSCNRGMSKSASGVRIHNNAALFASTGQGEELARVGIDKAAVPRANVPYEEEAVRVVGEPERPLPRPGQQSGGGDRAPAVVVADEQEALGRGGQALPRDGHEVERPVVDRPQRGGVL